MRRRRRLRVPANHDRWLVSYADFITLLFAFFVVLYASSQVDQRKVGKLALAIQVAFQELGVFPASTTEIPLDNEEPMPFSTVQAIQNVSRSADLSRVAPATDGPLGTRSNDTDLSTLQVELQQALHKEISMHAVAMHRETEGLVISLREFGFFGSGSATIKPESLAALNRIASILAVRTYRLRIEGHTDNVPIHTTDGTGPRSDRGSPFRSRTPFRRRLRRVSPHRQQSHGSGESAEPPCRHRCLELSCGENWRRLAVRSE